MARQEQVRVAGVVGEGLAEGAQQLFEPVSIEEADYLRLTLAEFDFRAGRPGAAADRITSALDCLSVPLTHPDALQDRSNLACCLWQDGRTAEALSTYRELLPDVTRILPQDHPLVAQTIQNIAALSGHAPG